MILDYKHDHLRAQGEMLKLCFTDLLRSTNPKFRSLSAEVFHNVFYKAKRNGVGGGNKSTSDVKAMESMTGRVGN